MSVQSGLGPAGEVFALQEGKSEKDLVLTDSEKNKEDINGVQLEETKNSAELVEVTGKEEKKAPQEEKKNIKNLKVEEKADESVVSEITTLIEKSNFSEMINVFSDSLFWHPPENDEFEGQEYEVTDLEITYNEQIKGQAQEVAQLIASVNSFERFDEKEVKQQVILLNYLMRWGTFSDDNSFWMELYTPDSTLLTGEEVKSLNKRFVELFESAPVRYLPSDRINVAFTETFKAAGKSWTYKQSVEQYLSQVKKYPIIPNGFIRYSLENSIKTIIKEQLTMLEFGIVVQLLISFYLTCSLKVKLQIS